MKKSASKTFRVLAAAAVAVGTLGACNSQRFSVPPGDQEFGQKATYTTQVDILWVIDTSSSMGAKQDGLAAQVGSFIDALNYTKLDYQIGVTTMDMSGSGEKGKLIYKAGTQPILNSATPNLSAVLADRLRVGEFGSPTERGMEAVRAALTGSLADNENKGFLRPNALLVLIFLSDENDKSEVFDDIKFLDTLRPPLPLGDRSWMAQFMGVVENDAACTTQGQFADIGHRYIAMTKASAGVAESICDANYARALTNVKARLLSVLTEFPLKDKPSLTSIKVRVDGLLVPQSDQNGWTYYEPKNSIRFHGTAIPKPGAIVKIDYNPADIR